MAMQKEKPAQNRGRHKHRRLLLRNTPIPLFMLEIPILQTMYSILQTSRKNLPKNYAENLTAFFGTASSGIVAAINLSDEVLSYRPAVERAAAKYGMSDYVDLILAVMMQESGGRGLDVMQAAEGGFNTRYPMCQMGLQILNTPLNVEYRN